MARRTVGKEQSQPLNISLLSKAALVLFVLLLAGVYFVGSLFDGPQQAEEATFGTLDGRFPPDMTMIVDGTEYGYYNNYFTNILIMGVDKEELTSAAAFRSGGQADFLMLLAIDRHTRTITPIHIDRDTVAEVKVYSPFGQAVGVNRMQICLSHAFGNNNQLNCENTIWAVEKLLHGIPVDQFLALDMTGIADLNDALGGVEVTLEDDFTHLDSAMTRGKTLTLQGRQAEYFVRGRHDVGDQTNLQRMERQRVFLNGLSDLFFRQSKEDPMLVARLFDKLESHMHTSMDAEWASRQTYALEHYQRNAILDLQGEHRRGADGFMEFHADEEELKQLIRDVFLVDMRKVGLQ